VTRPGAEPVATVLDTDGGIDDCMALWWGLEARSIDVVTVTTVFGNVSLDQATRNVAKVLHHADRLDIPVACGAAHGLGPAPIEAPAHHIHGEDGLGRAGPADVDHTPLDITAAAEIARLVASRPGELTLVAVGPLTNIALVLRAHPEIAQDVRALTVMGGVARPPGNVTPIAEFNVACDPTAAAEVVAAPWREPPLLVPLDVTYVATLGATELALLEERRTPAAAFLAAPIAHYRARASRQSRDGGCPAHDLLALMTVAHPELVTASLLPLTVDTGASSAWGATVVDLRTAIPDAGTPRWRVALDVDVDAFRARARALFGA